MRVLVVAALMAFGSMQVPVLAQQGTADGRCSLGSVTFSPGAVMSAGTATAVCAGGSWEASTAEAAGCLLEGELSSVGAVVGINNNDTMSLRCAKTGRWESIEIGAAAE